jgi:hypothetical protein
VIRPLQSLLKVGPDGQATCTVHGDVQYTDWRYEETILRYNNDYDYQVADATTPRNTVLLSLMVSSDWTTFAPPVLTFKHADRPLERAGDRGSLTKRVVLHRRKMFSYRRSPCTCS